VHTLVCADAAATPAAGPAATAAAAAAKLHAVPLMLIAPGEEALLIIMTHTNKHIHT